MSSVFFNSTLSQHFVTAKISVGTLWNKAQFYLQTMVVNVLHDFGTKSSLLFLTNKAGKETTELQKPINIPIYLIQMHFKEQLQPPDISRSSKLGLCLLWEAGSMGPCHGASATTDLKTSCRCTPRERQSHSATLKKPQFPCVLKNQHQQETKRNKICKY